MVSDSVPEVSPLPRKALNRTAILLRSIAASEFSRYRGRFALR